MAKINIAATRIVTVAEDVATIQARKMAIAKEREKLELKLEELDDQEKELNDQHIRFQREMDKLVTAETLLP